MKSPDGDDSDLVAEATEEGKKVTNELCGDSNFDCWFHVMFPSLSAADTLGLLFILSVGCARGWSGAVWVGTAAWASRGT